MPERASLARRDFMPRECAAKPKGGRKGGKVEEEEVYDGGESGTSREESGSD